MLQGWRFVFYVMAGVAGLTTLALLMFGKEPRTKHRKKPQQVSTKVQSPVKVNLKRGVNALKVGNHYGYACLCNSWLQGSCQGASPN